MSNIAIRRGTAADIAPVAVMFADAFLHDPFTIWAFGEDDASRWEATRKMFGLTTRARIVLDQPILVAVDGGELVGCAHLKSPDDKKWTDELNAEWEALCAEAGSDPVSRIERYQEAKKPFERAEPHHYLVVIGVAPRLHGHGVGSRLMEAVWQEVVDDPKSMGLALDTLNPANRNFYKNRGLEEYAEAELKPGINLWCYWRPKGV